MKKHTNEDLIEAIQKAIQECVCGSEEDIFFGSNHVNYCNTGAYTNSVDIEYIVVKK